MFLTTGSKISFKSMFKFDRALFGFPFNFSYFKSNFFCQRFFYCNYRFQFFIINFAFKTAFLEAPWIKQLTEKRLSIKLNFFICKYRISIKNWSYVITTRNILEVTTEITPSLDITFLKSIFFIIA